MYKNVSKLQSSTIPFPLKPNLHNAMIFIISWFSISSSYLHLLSSLQPIFYVSLYLVTCRYGMPCMHCKGYNTENMTVNVFAEGHGIYTLKTSFVEFEDRVVVLLPLQKTKCSPILPQWQSNSMTHTCRISVYYW